MDSLSKRQQQIYNFIESYIEQKGFGPTVREICEAVNLSSPSTVHVHLKTYHRRSQGCCACCRYKGRLQDIRNS